MVVVDSLGEIQWIASPSQLSERSILEVPFSLAAHCIVANEEDKVKHTAAYDVLAGTSMPAIPSIPDREATFLYGYICRQFRAFRDRVTIIPFTVRDIFHVEGTKTGTIAII